ncbi:MAG: hypothetical protein HKP30_10520 [Myxococcales bacterium]|nr:hypothetical protein [Myxococcales bacterium]
MAQERKNAFVVWIDPEAGPAGRADRYRGRIEHVPTSTREAFDTRDELLAFMERFFDAGDGSEGPGNDEPLR